MSDDANIISDLARDFSALSSQENYAHFVDRVELALDQISSPLHRALLHYMAADCSMRAGEEHIPDGLKRALDHVESARSTLLAIDKAAYTQFGGLIALLRAQLYLNKEPPDPAEFRTSIEASEEALSLAPVGIKPELLGALAYNTGLRSRRLSPTLPDEKALLGRTEALFHKAVEQYDAAGMTLQAADASEQLAVLGLMRLQAGAAEHPNLEATFAETWRFAEKAMAALGTTASPTVWARRNELAAAIIQHQPGKTNEANAGEAIKYLDRALLRYQSGTQDLDAAANCAAQILSLMDTFPRPWSGATAQRYTAYLSIRAAPHLSEGHDPRVEAIVAISAAAAWEHVNDDVQTRTLRVREYAETALEKALEIGENAIAATALVSMGNQLIAPDHVSQGSEELCLAEATRLFERAVALAREGEHHAIEAQALRRLGVVLSRRVTEYNNTDVLDRAVETFRHAAATSAGAEHAASLINLGTMLLWSARSRGNPIPLDEINQLIIQAQTFAETGAGVDDGIAKLRESLEAASTISRVPATRFAAHPTSLGYRIYQDDEQQLNLPGHVIRIVTLLITPDQGGGQLELIETNGEITAEFCAPCAKCRSVQKVFLPIFTSTSKPDLASRVQQMAQGELRCTSCGIPILVETTFALDTGARDGWTVFFPDALATGGRELVSQQVDIIRQLHFALFGHEVEVADVVPWGGILAYGLYFAARSRSALIAAHLTEVARGLSTRQPEQIRQGLIGYLASANADDPSKDDTLKAIGTAIASDPQSDKGAVNTLAAAAVDLVGLARVRGVEYVMAHLQSAFAHSSARDSAIEASLLTAADKEARRSFLRRYLREAPDYSSDREQAMSELLLVGAELELQDLRRRKIDVTDPPKYAHAIAMLALNRDLAKQMIAKDRIINSAGPAKTILADALERDRHFVLFLRSFSIDVPVGSSPDALKSTTNRLSDGRFKWRTFTVRTDVSSRSAHKIAEFLAPHAPMVMVVNAVDPFPPEKVAKLYATDVDWRNLVFPLIAEAAATILLLDPASRSLDGGVADELTALVRLERTSDTIIVLADPATTRSFWDAAEALPLVRSLNQNSPEELRKLGFEVLLRESEITSTPTALIDAVMGRLNRSARKC